MIFHVNHLPADDSHKLSCLICHKDEESCPNIFCLTRFRNTTCFSNFFSIMIPFISHDGSMCCHLHHEQVKRSGSLDWGSKCCYFGTHPRQNRCIVSFSKILYPLLSTGSTQEGRKLSRHDWKIVDCDVKHQNKQIIMNMYFISNMNSPKEIKKNICKLTFHNV